MTNSWMNADGEPIMDGAAYRFEQALDSDSWADSLNDPYRDDYEGDPCEDGHECNDCDGPKGRWMMVVGRGHVFVPDEGAGWSCSWCSRPCPKGSH